MYFIKYFFNQLNTKYFILICFAIFIIAHLPFLDLPPTGAHVWRQSNTLALARNFFEEGMEIWLPKVDKRWDHSGVTGCNFPLYEWLLACLYKLFGFSHALHRIFSLVITLISAYFIYRFFLPKGVQIAKIGLFVFLFNPLIFYYGFSALPDNLALLFVLIANVQLSNYFRTNIKFNLGLYLVFVALALMIKYTFALWLFLPFLLFSDLKRSQIVLTGIATFIALIPVLVWYQYANYLTAISGGLVEFISAPRLVQFKDLPSLFSSLISILPELFFGYPFLMIFIIALFKIKKESLIKRKFVLLLISLISFAYFIAASNNLAHHDYYLFPFLGLVIFIGVLQFQQYQKNLIYMMLILMPIWAGIRIIPANWQGKNKHELQLEQQEICKIIPKNSLVICGVDETGCYLFYMLHCKGFPYYYKNELFEKKQIDDEIYIEEVKNRGAAYLITNSKADLENPQIKQKYASPIQVGKSLWVLQLH